MVKRWAELRRKRWVRWTIDLSIIVAIIAIAGLWQTRGHLSGNAPAFTLQTLGGKTVSLESLAGKPVLLAFWAPWCGVCKTESQNFSWVKKVVGDRAHVLSVASSWEDVTEVQAYVAENGVDYPVLLDVERLAGKFKVEAFPTVYFLDREGRVKRSAVGYTTTGGLILRLLVP
jgi:thiol-disulfide isomerase/thioredoxin